jgi:hypothetical protein
MIEMEGVDEVLVVVVCAEEIGVKIAKDLTKKFLLILPARRNNRTEPQNTIYIISFRNLSYYL